MKISNRCLPRVNKSNINLYENMVTNKKNDHGMKNPKCYIVRDMCRICMTSTVGQKQNVNYKLTPEICRMLNTCTQINVEPNDNLPQFLCISCYKQLNETFMFITLARKTNKTFGNYIKNANTVPKYVHEEKKLPSVLSVCVKQENEVPENVDHKRIKKSDFESSDYCTDSCEILRAVGLVKIADSEAKNIKINCDICSKKYISVETYKRHLAREHGELCYKCRICAEKFKSRLNLQKHLSSIHSGRKPYRCIECKIRYKTLENLTAHIRKLHVGKVPFTCKFCKNGFDTKNQLQSHLQTHKTSPSTKKQEKIFRCRYCNREFKKNSDLSRHLRVHTGEKPFICKVCNLGFQQGHNLTKHMVIHTKKKEFICDICNKKFGRNDSMVRHMLVHSLKKPHVCSKCNKTFARFSQLEIHVKNRHPDSEIVKTE